jgi:hypothetical protein
MWKEATILKYYSGICLMGLRKIAKNLTPLGPRLNPEPLGKKKGTSGILYSTILECS